MLLSTTDFCRLSGTPRGSVFALRAQGLLPPAVPAGEAGRADLWSLEQTLAAAVGRWLRSQGVDAEHAGAVIAALWTLNRGQLEAAFRRGDCWLHFIGPVAAARLAGTAPPEELRGAVDRGNLFHRVALLKPRRLNVSTIYDRLRRAAEELQAGQAADSPTAAPAEGE